MKTYDWIVVGAGITGAALAYELAQQGLAVLVIEQYDRLQGSSRYGYGGIAYWCGTTDLTRQLCAEGIEIQRSLSQELGRDTQFRELDLVLTILPTADPKKVAQSYAQFAMPPELVDVQTACELEPLLNPAAIAGAMVGKHGHVNLGKTVDAYLFAYQSLGGTVQLGKVTAFMTQQDRMSGVVCGAESYYGNNVVVCAGAMSRSLLKQAGITARVYFSHAELIETPPVEVRLRSLVMPAETQRFDLEAEASRAEIDYLWDEPGHEPVPAVLDAGAIQFMDGSLRIGQVSRTLTDPQAAIDGAASERALRQAVGEILPALQQLPGTWHSCLVAFSSDRLPLVGAVPGKLGLHLFSGFSNPLALVPAVARRFAKTTTGEPDELIAQLACDR